MWSVSFVDGLFYEPFGLEVTMVSFWLLLVSGLEVVSAAIVLVRS